MAVAVEAETGDLKWNNKELRNMLSTPARGSFADVTLSFLSF